VPDGTPGIIAKYALSDEQAILAKLRYNRLVDIFTGVTCYSLQSHLRTTATALGQVETDEVYIGVDKRGAHYVFPVQAKAGRDKINIVQIMQDHAMSREKFRDLICRPLAAQFMPGDVIAMFEFERAKTDFAIVSEKHYRLVPPEELTAKDLELYRGRRPLTSEAHRASDDATAAARQAPRLRPSRLTAGYALPRGITTSNPRLWGASAGSARRHTL